MMIREAKEEDLKKIVELLNQLSPSSEKPDLEKLKSILAKIIEDKSHYLCVVEENGNVIGTGLLLIQMNLSHGGQPYSHIENIVADANHRKKGVGKQIIAHLIEKAKEIGCYKIILNCEEHNIPFYEKCGMSKTGEIEMRLSLN